MRTKNFFRILLTAILFAVVCVSANAQVTTSGTASVDRQTTTNIPTATRPEAVDFATINSIMPYSVNADANVAAMVTSDPATFLASVFNWRISGGGAITAIGGGVLTIPVAGAPGYNPSGYPTDVDVEAHWGAVAGQYTLTVNELTRNTASLPTCAGSDSTLRVYLMPEPTASFNEANCNDGTAQIAGGATADGIIGGCSMNGVTVSFAVNVGGTQDFRISASSVYTPLGGGPAAPVTLGDQVTDLNGTGGTFDGAATSFLSAIPTAPNSTSVLAFNLAIPASGVGAYGKYVITLANASDLVSRKSFSDFATVNHGDLSAGLQAITVYSLPTPTTGTIRHVTNIGW